MQASAPHSFFALYCFMRRWSPQGERIGISGAIALRNIKHVAALVVAKHRNVKRLASPWAQ
jgi:hypothetical protein